MNNLLCLYRYLVFKNLSVFYDQEIEDFELNIKKYLKKEFVVSFQLGYSFTKKGVETLIFYIMQNNLGEQRVGQYFDNFRTDNPRPDIFYLDNKTLLEKLIKKILSNDYNKR